MPTRDRAALVLVALTLAFAVLALGGAPRWAACTASLLAIATAVPYATSRRTSSRPSILLFPLAIAAGLTALQLVPLPAAIADQIASGKLDVATANAMAWNDPRPTWVVASFDPPATLVELAKLVGYLALAYTCVRLASNRRARHGLGVIVAGVATLAAVVTLVHHALGLSKLYGIYQPAFQPHVLGPLLGVNHLASLLALAVPIALALAVAAIGIVRIGWLAAAGVLAATTLLTASRGGAIGLTIGLIVTVVMLLVQRRSGTSDANRPLPISAAVPAAIVAVCTVILLAVLTAGDVARDLSRTSFVEHERPQSKYELWSRAIELSANNRWLGVGRGGFEPAFTPVAESGHLIYSHAENSYLQALIDWGLPGAAAVLLALGSAALRGARRWRHGPLEAGILGGLASLAVHDIADFSIELPAVAMTAVVAASIVLPTRLGTETETSGARVKNVRREVLAMRAGLLAGATALIALALSPLGRDARTDSARIAEIDDVAARLDRARAAQARHPADHVIAGQAAESLFATRNSEGLPDPRALEMIRRAIAMNPKHPGLHHLAGRMLLRSSRPDQAAPEFAEAVRWSVDVAPVVADVVAGFRDPAAGARALPPEPRHVWRVYAALTGHDAHALAYATRVAELYPDETPAQALLAVTALASGRLDLALPAARMAWEGEAIAQHATLYARALALGGDRAHAIEILGEAAERDNSSTIYFRCELLFVMSDLQLETHDMEGAKATLERVATIGANDRTILVAMHLRRAAVEERQGNRNQAEWERKRARELEQQ